MFFCRLRCFFFNLSHRLHHVGLLCLLGTALLPSAYAVNGTSTTSSPSIAFYYSYIDSVRELISYKRVVLEPRHVKAHHLDQLHQANTSAFAYLSVGEASPTVAREFKTAMLKKNSHWNAVIMNGENPKWRDYLLNQAKSFKQRGFDGVFLDTLDSHEMALNKTQQQTQKQAHIALINQLHAMGLKVILNRGFDLVAQLDTPPHALVAESLYNTFDVKSGTYSQVKPKDSEWLTFQLKNTQAQGVEAIVIDYLPLGQNARIQAAKKILKSGFTPYVSDGLLTQFGVSVHYPVPRRVLGFYDGANVLKKQSKCHTLTAMPIEYQGYVPQCHDVRSFNFNHFDPTRYAAILYWLDETTYEEIPALSQFITRHIDHTPSAFLGALPTRSSLLKRLNLKTADTYQGKLTVKNTVQFIPQSPLPNASNKQIKRYQLIDPNKAHTHVLATLNDSDNKTGLGLVKTAWGGVLFSPLTLNTAFSKQETWVLDPFKAWLPLLQLPPIPAPDITTESGLRIATSHIDGDGFPSRAWQPGKPYASEVIYRDILKKFDFPHTVSVVEAEVGKSGLYPEQSDALEAIARNMFALDNVELASHTFSHPFFWDTRVEFKKKLYGDSLPVPNYTLNYDREISGSVNYINTHLAPKNKKVKVFLWSGLANPTPDIVEKTKKLGLYNVNGGNTFVLYDAPHLSSVYPHLYWNEDAVQVYAPIINENLYTDLWTENFSGYKRVIETFKLLGSPRRLKPMSVYYHMYSGAYPGTLKALQEVYQWLENTPHTPLYLSEFAQRAQHYYETGIARSISNDGWYISSTGVRSLRIGKKWYLGGASRGVAGYNSGTDGNYVTLIAPRAVLFLSKKPSNKPALLSANGVIENWQYSPTGLTISVNSHIPLKMKLRAADKCQLTQQGQLITAKTEKSYLLLTAKKKGRFTFALTCSNPIGNEKHVSI